MRVTLILISFIFITAYTSAQPVAGYGCLSASSGNPSPIVNNAVYQTLSTTYNSSPAYRAWSTTYSNRTLDAVQHPCWKWTLVTPNGCYLRRKNGMPNQSSNFVLGNYGYFTGNNGQVCVDLDTQIWILFGSTLILSTYTISKHKLIHFEA